MLHGHICILGQTNAVYLLRCEAQLLGTIVDRLLKVWV